MLLIGSKCTGNMGEENDECTTLPASLHNRPEIVYVRPKITSISLGP